MVVIVFLIMENHKIYLNQFIFININLFSSIKSFPIHDQLYCASLAYTI